VCFSTHAKLIGPISHRQQVPVAPMSAC
jgi:hypothetical protein